LAALRIIDAAVLTLGLKKKLNQLKLVMWIEVVCCGPARQSMMIFVFLTGSLNSTNLVNK
jgi:hypothetical protein